MNYVTLKRKYCMAQIGKLLYNDTRKLQLYKNIVVNVN